MKKTIAIIQARHSSSRLPGKILADLGGRSILQWVVDSARSIVGVDQVIVATSTDSSDDETEKYCNAYEIPCFRGSLNNVLARFYHAAEKYQADTVMRLTADCPLLDPQICGSVLRLLQLKNADYASNGQPPAWPDGMDCEVFTFEALRRTHDSASKGSHIEHVTPYIYENRHEFKVVSLSSPCRSLSEERWTLDTPEDLEFLRAVVTQLGVESPPSYLQVLQVLEKNPQFRSLNNLNKRNEGFQVSKNIDSINSRENPEFKKSLNYLERVEKVIPGGSQTFSKSKTQYPPGFAPLFASHGHKGRIWDIDGNEYVDLVNGLLPNVLGYNDPDVDEAICNQLNNGITLSLATSLECELAERLVSLIPCAEMVRFGKNGSDATSGCVRLARAATSRDRVMVCGYHGWQDWYIGSTSRSKGVPSAVRELTHSVPYNDLNAVEALLEEHHHEFACLIMEPMSVVEPEEGYLENLKNLLHKHGSLLVFDEVVTGFRFDIGGAQKLFGVTPDLASFGKSMGNGMPISAIVGKREYMKEMENIFFSGTFGGETLSLAASIAVIDKMVREPVIEKLWKTGHELKTAIYEIVKSNDLTSVVQLKGKDPLVVLGFKESNGVRPEAIKTFLLHELHCQGVLTLGTHNVCYAHDDRDIQSVITAYSLALDKLGVELRRGDLEQRMELPVNDPIFSVRKP